MKKSAETLKNEMRQMIEGLRGQFRRLLAENEQLPADIKIPRDVNRRQILRFSRTLNINL